MNATYSPDGKPLAPITGPYPPQCAHWPRRGAHCTETSVGWLMHPDGTPNPGGFMCLQHGQACVDEYREKLGEAWTFAPLRVTF